MSLLGPDGGRGAWDTGATRLSFGRDFGNKSIEIWWMLSSVSKRLNRWLDTLRVWDVQESDVATDGGGSLGSAHREHDVRAL